MHEHKEQTYYYTYQKAWSVGEKNIKQATGSIARPDF